MARLRHLTPGNGTPGHRPRPTTGPKSHPFIAATEAVEAGTVTLQQVFERHGARFANVVVYALKERQHQRQNLHKHRDRASMAEGGRKGSPAAKGSRPTAAELIQRLQAAVKEIGRTPRQSDLVLCGLPASGTWRRHFGTYGKACRLAGVKVNWGRQHS